jgi:cellulose 1,4-beta-cellobiosidase
LIATPDDSQVMLNWSAASGATRYNLKRSTTNGGPYTVIASNLTFLTYTDTGVFNGTNYYYVVSAMNVGVESTNSIQAAAMPNVVPDVPTSLAAIAGDGYVSLSWLNSSGAANYFIKRSLVFGGPYNAIATNGVSVTFTNTGLSNGTRYYFVVSAWNSAGESVDSIEAGALPVSQMPPLLGFGIAGGQIQFSWPLDHTGWLLQAQTNSTDAGLGTNWVTASGSNVTNQMSIPLDVGNASVFFRLISP